MQKKQSLMLLLCFVLSCLVAQPADFYINPNSGSDNNSGSLLSPWKNINNVLSQKNIKGGDTLYLMTGYHQSISISNKEFSSKLTIKPAPQHKPTVKNITISNCKNIDLDGLEISPSFGTPSTGTAVQINGNNITLQNCFIHFGTNSSLWDTTDWLQKTGHGLSVGGSYNIVKNNKIHNVDFGILSGATHSLISHNEIKNFRGDGLRGQGDYTTFEYNYIANCYNVDGNHDDGFQSYSVGTGGVGSGVVKGVILRGNTIINNEDPQQPFQGSLQGIGCFDGTYEDWIVENNLIVVNHYHGITFAGAINCKIINNTVVDMKNGTPGPAWIKIGKHKNGTPSNNCLIRNNIAHKVIAESGVNADHNLIIQNLNDIFTNPEQNDFTLFHGSLAVDQGSNNAAPTLDLLKNQRPQGHSTDIGAYEYQSFTNQPQNQPPYFTDSIKSSHASPTTQQVITLSISAQDPENKTLIYSWDLGDQQTQTGAIITHSYSQPGKYLVKVTVKDEQGLEANDSIEITVIENAHNEQVDQDLLVYLPITETTGNTIKNNAHDHSHGSLFGNAKITVNGYLQNGVSIGTNSSDKIEIGDLNINGNQMSLMAWVYIHDITHLSSWDSRIISKASSTSEQDHTWMLSTIAHQGEHRLRFRLKTNGQTKTLIASSGSLPLKSWAHVAAIYDGKSMKLYLNGTEVGNISQSGPIAQNNQLVAIGNQPNGAGHRSLNGTIDEIKIYQRALTDAELFEIATATTNSFQIEAVAEANGSISPSGTITLTAQEQKTFVVKPNSGYQIKSVTLDGKDLGKINEYTFEGINDDHVITASFEKIITNTQEVKIAEDNFTQKILNGGTGWASGWKHSGNAKVIETGWLIKKPYDLFIKKGGEVTRDIDLSMVEKAKLSFAMVYNAAGPNDPLQILIRNKNKETVLLEALAPFSYNYLTYEFDIPSEMLTNDAQLVIKPMFTPSWGRANLDDFLIMGTLKNSSPNPEPQPEPEPEPEPEPTTPSIPNFPNANTTGPKKSNLTASSSITITKDGAVYDGYAFSGMVIIKANNVTLRNFTLDGNNAHYGVKIEPGYRGTILEDGKIFDINSSGIYGGDFIARRLEVFDSGADGFKPTGNATIEGCWIHHMGRNVGSHADGIQMRAGKNVYIKNNYFDMPFKQQPGYNNSICIIIQTGDGPIDNVSIEGNWFNGAGSYAINIHDKGAGHGRPTNVKVINNSFTHNYQYGIWTIKTDAVIKGNYWAATGLPVNSNQ